MEQMVMDTVGQLHYAGTPHFPTWEKSRRLYTIRLLQGGVALCTLLLHNTLKAL